MMNPPPRVWPLLAPALALLLLAAALIFRLATVKARYVPS